MIAKTGTRVYSLADIYCIYNRTRTTGSLIAPADLLKAARLMSRLGLPVRLHKFTAKGMLCFGTRAGHWPGSIVHFNPAHFTRQGHANQRVRDSRGFGGEIEISLFWRGSSWKWLNGPAKLSVTASEKTFLHFIWTFLLNKTIFFKSKMDSDCLFNVRTLFLNLKRKKKIGLDVYFEGLSSGSFSFSWRIGSFNIGSRSSRSFSSSTMNPDFMTVLCHSAAR